MMSTYIPFNNRLSYVARAPHHYEFVFTELMQNQPRNASAYDFNRLPGNTSYCAIVVALYSNGQRVPASPVQYMLPGYGELSIQGMHTIDLQFDDFSS